MNTLFRLLPLAMLSLLVLACGGTTTAPTAQQPAPLVATTAPSTPAALPTAAQTAAVIATPVQTTLASPVAETLPTTAASGEGREQAIPRGQTAEGYWYLGRADAPVTLSMYSDFL